MILRKRLRLLFGILLAISFVASVFFLILRKDKNADELDKERTIFLEKIFLAKSLSESGIPQGELSSPLVEAEEVIVVAKVKKNNLKDVTFKAKWYYEEFSRFEPFFEAQSPGSEEKKYLVSALKATKLPKKLDRFKVFSDLFPLGDYRVEWYSQGTFEQEVRFSIGQ